MVSKKLQQILPDENKKGDLNAGVVGQFPYFAPNVPGLKKAPKMTNADEEYLKRFIGAVRDEEIAQEKKSVLGLKDPKSKRPIGKGPPQGGDDGDNKKEEVNQRLI